MKEVWRLEKQPLELRRRVVLVYRFTIFFLRFGERKKGRMKKRSVDEERFITMSRTEFGRITSEFAQLIWRLHL